MIKYAHVLTEAATTPWAMEPRKLAAMVGILRFAAMGGKLSSEEIDHRLDAAKIHPNTDKSIANRPGAIAMISLRGVLSNRAPMVNDVSSGTGTNMDQFCAAVRGAMNSDDVKAIVFDVDSPGGSVYGSSEASKLLFDCRGQKPMVAQVNALCASAAYWVASACDEIVVTPSGQVGSIGVYTIHEEISKFLEEQGVKETIISAGKYKTEGNPYEPLSAEALAAMQTMVDGYYRMFVDAISRNRGVASQAVIDGFGQGRCVGSAEAVSLGMADRVATLSETLNRWGVKMGGKSKSASAAAPEGDAPVAKDTQAIVDALNDSAEAVVSALGGAADAVPPASEEQPAPTGPVATPRLNIARRKQALIED